MTSPIARHDRMMSAAEVALVTLLLAAQIWLFWEWLPVGETVQRVTRVASVVLLVATLVFSFLRVRDSREDLGLTAAHMKSGWWPIAAFTIGALVVLIAMAFILPDASRSELNVDWLFTYTHGMLGQQLALQWFLNNRVHRALDGRPEPMRSTWTIITCVIVFTLLHAPNPGLMLSVIPASAFWCWHFRRFRNMPALLLSHIMLGGAAMMLLGDGPLMRLRIGPPALRMLLGE